MFHKRLIKEFKDNRKYVIGMVCTQWVILFMNVILMLVTSRYIVLMFKDRVTLKAAIWFGMALLAVLTIRIVITTLNSRMSFKASFQVKFRLRNMIYKKLMSLGASYRSRISTSEVVQISTEGVEQLEIYFAKYVPQFFYSILAALTLFGIVGRMNLKVAVILIICVPLIPISIIAVQKLAKRILKKYWGIYTELGDSFLECLQGLTTLKIYQADERYAQKMDKEAEKFRKVTMRVLIMQLNSISIMDLIAYGGSALGIILSVLEYQSGFLNLEQCFFIIMISAEFFLPLRLLGSFFHIAMNGNAAADKIFQLLDETEPEQGTSEEISSNPIQLEHVSFSYDKERYVLSDISLQIKEKGITALVGESGCGKSTVTAMIMGEYIPLTGNISLGDIPNSQIQPELLRKKITKIKHDSYIFQGTVKENLLMGNENATDKALIKALDTVGLLDLVLKNGGLNMELKEKASNLSGGQKQRLALARALLHDSDVYIFDEATSNVDAESEDRFMEVVRKLALDKAVIFISHRLSNVINSDIIYVLQNGSMIESGIHKELWQRKGHYYKLYEEQKKLESFGKELYI
jgi:ABC-type transport system involved in cytochrome bd biosynthesis fused ATPase/permease subunit